MTELRSQDKERLKDKEYRINHLYFIKDKNKQLIQFKPNRAQADFDKNKHFRNIILKSRQLGFTTFEAMDMFDDVLFQRNFDGLFIAQDLETARDVFSNKIDLAWKNFKLKDLYISDTSSARQIKLGFGDNTFSSITVDSSGRAGTYHRLHITEFDTVCKNFPNKAKEIIEGSIPTVPTNGRVDIESTAKQSEGLFYDIFMNAWENQIEHRHPTEFKAHFYNWTWDDEELKNIKPLKELPIEFIEYQRQYNLTDKEITYYYFKWLSLNKEWSSLKSEYPTTVDEAFEGAGNKLFDLIKVGKLEIKEGEKVGDWIYYEKYKLGNDYRAGCDVAEGVGQDSSTIVIWNFTALKPKVVAIYKNNKIAPDLFAYEIKNGCEIYGNAFVAVERNNHGHTTISKLKEIYPIQEIFVDNKDKLGWETNLVSKPKMMFDFSTAVNNELVDIPCRHLISEMRRYDKEELSSARFDEDKTQHYDLLIAAAIGFQMRTEKKKSEVKIYRPNWIGYGKKK